MDHIFTPCNAPKLGNAPCGKIADLAHYIGTSAGQVAFTDIVKTGYVTVTLTADINGVDKTITVGNKSSPFYNNGTFITQFTFGGNTSAGCDFTIYDSTGGDLNEFLQGVYENSCDSTRAVVLVDFGWIVLDAQENVGTKVTNGKQLSYKWGAGTYTPSMKSYYKGIPNFAPSQPGFDIPLAGVDEFSGVVDRSGSIGNRLGFSVDKLEVSFSAEGTWTYKINCTTLLERRSQRRLTQTNFGDDFNPLSIKDAVGLAVANGCPDANGNSANTVNLWIKRGQVIGTNNPLNFKNSEGGPDGPKAVWHGNVQSPTQFARNNLNGLTTDTGMGMVLYTDPIIDAPNLVVLSADESFCVNPNGALCRQNPSPEYVFIVNGGNCTPVLQFTPTVQYTIGAKAIGGTAGGGMVAQAINFEAADLCADLNSPNKINLAETGEGEQAQGTIPGNMNMWRYPNNVVKESNQALSQNLAANSFAIQSSNITAELKIVGNPEFVNLAKCQGWFIGIIFINQPQVTTNSRIANLNNQALNSNEKYEWLATPSVNATFTRMDYLIMGVSHSIDASGDYTTTLRLQAVPEQARQRNVPRFGN